MKITRYAAMLSVMAGSVALAAALPSEISVQLKLANSEYVLGERIRAVVDVANASADPIDARRTESPDCLILELYRAGDRHRFGKVSEDPFVKPFALLSGEGQQMPTFIGDHFGIVETTRYLVRAVLVHGNMRYESSLKSFTVVPGLRCGGALQIFAGNEGLKREFELVHWGRDRAEHLFLKAKDSGISSRRWQTTDLGPFLRVTAPKVSVLPTGQVITLHRITQDSFVRSEFWSLPAAFEFHGHEQLFDPDVVGAERVKELYKEAGSVEPEKKSWWKFW